MLGEGLRQQLGTLGLEPISRQIDLAQSVKGAELRGHSCAARMETQPCDRGQVMVGVGGSPQVPQETGCWFSRWWGRGSSGSASSGGT